MEELLFGRIGNNEIFAIKICKFFIDAQKVYYSRDRDGDGIKSYARHFVSAPDRKDGLYWEYDGENEASPFGPLVGRYVAAGYSLHQDADPILRGYRYRILENQSTPTGNGKKLFLDSKGRLRSGVALLAYPVRWQHSGVMSFQVGLSGEVYEKDLGAETETIAQAIDVFNPTADWKRID